MVVGCPRGESGFRAVATSRCCAGLILSSSLPNSCHFCRNDLTLVLHPPYHAHPFGIDVDKVVWRWLANITGRSVTRASRRATTVESQRENVPATTRFLSTSTSCSKLLFVQLQTNPLLIPRHHPHLPIYRQAHHGFTHLHHPTLFLQQLRRFKLQPLTPSRQVQVHLARPL